VNDVVDVQSLDLTERIRKRRRDMLGIPEPTPAAAGPPTNETAIERLRRVSDEQYTRSMGGLRPVATGSGESTDHTDRIRALRERLQAGG